MSNDLNKIVNLLLDGTDDDALIEVQSIKKLHSYSETEWLGATCHLGNDGIELLINNLILMRKRNNLHTGGSVSPIRWLYGFYIETYQDTNKRLFDWIIHNSENPYEPTGNFRHRCK